MRIIHAYFILLNFKFDAFQKQKIAFNYKRSGIVIPHRQRNGFKNLRIKDVAMRCTYPKTFRIKKRSGKNEKIQGYQ